MAPTDEVVSFDVVTGRRLGRLPAESWAWTKEVNGSGSLKVVLPASDLWESLNLWELTEPKRTALAVVSGGEVIHAGPVFQPEWDSDAGKLTVLAGGCWDLLADRLVVPYGLRNYAGGTVLGSAESGYPAAWKLEFKNQSLGSIARGLIAESQRIAPLPIALPAVEAGLNERTYNGPDLAPLAQRIKELTEVLNGPEILFEPRLREGGRRLEWVMTWGSPELVTGEHMWDMRLPSHPITGLKVNGDSAGMVTDAWARGGSQDDQTLIAHSKDTFLTDRGWPMIQSADTSHSTVSQLATLTSYTRGMTASRSRLSYTVSFRARRLDELGRDFADAVTVGDHIHLRVADPYLGNDRLALKVLGMSGDAGEWVTFSARPVIDWGT